MFRWLAQTANMAEAELLKTFNCGIGMILVVAEEAAGPLSNLLTDQGETVFRLGRVVPGQGVLYSGRLL